MGSLHVIGLGTALTLPSAAAQDAIAAADLVIGGQRHLDALTPITARTQAYPSPFADFLTLVEREPQLNIVLLASGDPLFFGIGGFLRRKLPDHEIEIHPNLSSMQTAFSRLGLPWQEAQLLSLHGRPMGRLRAILRNHQRIAVLTDRTNNPVLIGQQLLDCGYEASTVHVLEALDSDAERIGCFSIRELIRLPEDHFDPLNVVIIETAGKGGLLPEFPGIDDASLLADAEGRRMYTKRQVRLAALSLLQSRAGDTGWDIGAGCGGLTLEWVRWHPRSQVHALETSRMRLDCLHANQQRFGDHGNLSTHLGHAPGALAALPDPDRVFIGGNAGQLPQILASCWSRLRPGGRMVAVAVTLESRQQLNDFARDTAMDVPAHLEEIGISQSAELGEQTVLKPQLPVLMLLVSKP